MSIGETSMFSALCDICGEPADDECVYPTREAAYQSAVDAGWICDGDVIICQDCHRQAPAPDPLQESLFGMTP